MTKPGRRRRSILTTSSPRSRFKRAARITVSVIGTCLPHRSSRIASSSGPKSLAIAAVASSVIRDCNPRPRSRVRNTLCPHDPLREAVRTTSSVRVIS
ncbi:hypothetical protein BDW75DRAFT_224818 [Aspergillus navahoensis]